MSRTAWTAGACVASAALAYWLGARGASAPPPPPAASPLPSRLAAPPARLALAPTAGLTVDDVRAVVREELSAVRDDTAATAPVAEATEAARATAVTTAHVAISDGLRDGIWDERDRVTLGTQVARLGPDDAAEAIAPLFAAINAQQVELRGPPL